MFVMNKNEKSYQVNCCKRRFLAKCGNALTGFFHHIKDNHDLKMLRYSEIPRDISGDSLAALKISENSDDISPASKCSSTRAFSTSNNLLNGCATRLPDIRHRKTSTPTVSSGPGPSGCYYNHGNCLTSVPAHAKSQSLPNRACHKNCKQNYSCAVFDILRIPAEDFAAQLTILDWPVFFSIQPDELTSCGWNKKNKLTVAPNVVAFSKRFNHVSFWTVQEILAGTTVKLRSETLAFFIRIAKKLYELNNFHSLFAIISALQSASIYRLSKTWGSLPKKDKQTFDKLAEVFADENNWANLRSHIESLKLPCIPYLGLYLTDLVYIDMAHPHSGGLESQQRTSKMNNILRIISNYQHSDYSNLTKIPHIQDYLHSIRYIEELQKFVEDDQYKLSLKLEPPSPAPSSSNNSSKESVSVDPVAIASLNLSPAKASSGSLRLQAVTSGSKFIPGHRKCRSLGTNIFTKSYQIGNFDPKETPKTLHLLDDSVVEDSTSRLSHSNLPSPTNHLPLQASHSTEDNCTLLTRLSDVDDGIEENVCPMQGCVRRKTVLKDGKKPTVSSWQRYWLQIWASSLVYFPPKSFKGHQRSDFKRDPCKMVALTGCQVLYCDSAMHQDSFQLVDHARGNVYKFRVGTKYLAERWCRLLQQAANGEPTPLPSNLMSFE
ncbi:unnamed protein product [Ceutorhynchus assimilis]|uniref:Ras-specific guanine nucleotide-releasing factor RalGPS2 n=1 Tax=Ceutorhynchus assimilis TaxID=467358 RepID=A0A9N9QES5_9CUCU|nr:unnamed protein product [Ceutorhynchus assimilis]